MKLVLTNLNGLHSDLIKEFEIGKEYEVSMPYTGIYVINNYTVSLSNFESPSQRFARLIPNAKKVVISNKTQGYSVDLLQTEKYLIVYSHSKGNHWNISGNHFKYYHDINTGEYIPEQIVENRNDKILIKQKMLKAELQALNSLVIR